MNATSPHNFLTASIVVTLSLAANATHAGEMTLNSLEVGTIQIDTMSASALYSMAYSNTPRFNKIIQRTSVQRPEDTEDNNNILPSFSATPLSAELISPGSPFAHGEIPLDDRLYAPVGESESKRLSLTGPTSLPLETLGHAGRNIWSHQIQSSGSWHPRSDKRMTLTGALSREFHPETDYINPPSRQNLTFNWGISHYVPLSKTDHLLLEIGPAGYDSWQITDHSAALARNPAIDHQVHGAGGQIGLIYLPWAFSLNFHGFYEFSAGEQYQGISLGLNIGKKF